MTKKEQGLTKGAIMRVFSRSELRKECLNVATVDHFDTSRPRVKKWAICRQCNKLTPKYLMEVDHIKPKIPLDRSLQEMTWDELVDNTWCDITNLQPLCPDCHSNKSKGETKQRAKNKRSKKNVK